MVGYTILCIHDHNDRGIDAVMKKLIFRNGLQVLLVLVLGIFAPLSLQAEKISKDITEYHQIIDKINESEIPEHLKNQLFNDLKTNMIETVRNSDVPEKIKKRLIQDLQQVSR